MKPGFTEFEFDLPEALLQNLIFVFDKMEAAPLVWQSVAELPDAQGVYQLLKDGKVVYIGKTDSDAGLKQRLARHAATIRHRQNLNTTEMTYKAVRVYVFTAMDLETELLKYYSSVAPVPWNNSGFGSNDPGRNRDNTKIKETHFDLLYPINIDEQVDIRLFNGISVAATLSALKSHLPYTARFEGGENSRSAHPELQNSIIRNSPKTPLTTRQVIMASLAALPPGWQASLLAGRSVFYKEERKYIFGSMIGSSGGLA